MIGGEYLPCFRNIPQVLSVGISISYTIMSLPGPVAASQSPDKFSKAILSVDALAQALSELNVDLDVNAFIDLVNKRTVKEEPPPSQRSRREFHKGKSPRATPCGWRYFWRSPCDILAAVVASLSNSIPVPPPPQPIAKRLDPASVDPALREKRRQMLADTRAYFNNVVPTPYLSVWAAKYENLQFIAADIEIKSNDGKYSLTFSEWCLWDTGAHLSMISGNRLSDDVKGANAPDAEFLEMSIKWVTLPPLLFDV
jgi:hypothetical protein